MKILAAAVALASFFAFTSPARASVSGSIGFDAEFVLANGSPTGNITTASMFTLENLNTTLNENGVFASLPLQAFAAITFQPGLGSSLHMSTPLFGDFQATSITKATSMPGFLDLFALGFWTAGTGEKISGTFPAEVRLEFTQSPAGTGEISSSGTMAITTVPELPSALLFLTGVGLLMAGTRLHKLLR